jgi:hypothetical protein
MFPTPESTKLLLENGRDDRSEEEIKGGLKDYVRFLAETGAPPNFRKNPWSKISSADPEFYVKLGEIVGKTLQPRVKAKKTGKGVEEGKEEAPVNDLIKKLEILYAEKLAGNNNVLTEAAEILDTLRRNNVIDIDMLKSISKRFAINKNE